MSVETDPERSRLYHVLPLRDDEVPMRIAILGTRGVPANYGGFETFAEEFGARLAARGHAVTVYGRDRYVDAATRTYRGMRVVRLPGPPSKYLETVVHSLIAAVHALGRSFDLVYVCNVANVPAVVLLRAFGRRVVLNVDGLEWRRAKWNVVGRSYYRLCAAIAARLPIEIVTDAEVIREHYLSAYRRQTRVFAYGADPRPTADDGTLGRLGLEAGRYILFVSRLEPENNAHVVLEAFRHVDSDMTLAIVGDAPYANEYIASLKQLADHRVRFTGSVYGPGYRILQSHAAAYIQATEVGGTHPALVEAMGHGNAILANDVPEHREVLGDAGRYYSGAQGLARQLRGLLADGSELERLGLAAARRAAERYSWDAITDAYERWFATIVRPA
jgi:glycosyltransferase involved in cell wall biosynthesis